MIRWLVAVPAWGDACVDVFCATALPALEEAILRLPVEVEAAPVVVHTDQPDRIAAAATRIRIEPRPVPAGMRDFDCLSQAHREVISMACRGDVVVFLTADLVVSAHGLGYCARVLEDPSVLMVACASVRALRERRIPATEDAAALMRWAWENRHPMTEACHWPSGNSADLSRVYFSAARSDGSLRVCARCALPHPLAVRVDGRALRFVPTVDANLIQCFVPSEIHLAPDSQELALVELSPRDKDYARSSSTMEQRVAAREVCVPDPVQNWLAGQRVWLFGGSGAASMPDGAFVAGIGRTS